MRSTGIGCSLYAGRLAARRGSGPRSLQRHLALFRARERLAGRLFGHLSPIFTPMNAGNDPLSGTPIFSAVMPPHRSLDRRGFAILMLAIAGVSFVAGLVFVIAGAWPVTGIFGLDALLIYWAFRINYRSARAYEEVRVTATQLILRKVSARGAVSEWRCNPLWVRLERTEDKEFG